MKAYEIKIRKNNLPFAASPIIYAVIVRNSDDTFGTRHFCTEEATAAYIADLKKNGYSEAVTGFFS